MRSIPISIAIFKFGVTASFFGFFWTYGVTISYYSNGLQFLSWLLLNPLIYIVLSLHYQKRTIRLFDDKWTKIIDKSIMILGFLLTFAAIASIYLSYRTSVWFALNPHADTVSGADVLILMFFGLVSGILIGLSILTVGYRWIPKSKEKRKL